MAIILIGHSQCPLCGKTLTNDDDVVGLPPLVDTSHPLYSYFDCGFHKWCYEQWDKREETEALLQKQREEFEKTDYYKEMLAKYGKPKQRKE